MSNNKSPSNHVETRLIASLPRGVGQHIINFWKCLKINLRPISRDAINRVSTKGCRATHN
ncbi:MAG: hypothetical protein KME64_41865 [Scytonematopsis contorta HA4267-MV1]|nr:hypothetical protein [Scytonematopsis contorta HA4267-MV1]